MKSLFKTHQCCLFLVGNVLVNGFTSAGHPLKQQTKLQQQQRQNMLLHSTNANNSISDASKYVKPQDSTFELIMDMLFLSSIVYPYSSVRVQLRKEQESKPKRSWLGLRSLFSQETLEWKNPSSFLVRKSRPENEIIEWVEANQEKLKTDENYMGLLNLLNDTASAHEQRELEVFDDQYQNEELVYAIGVNHYLKRISVVFRGSSTSKDWRQNFQAQKFAVRNERVSDPTFSNYTYNVHAGFRDYLKGQEAVMTEEEKEAFDKTDDDAIITKFKEILQYLMNLSNELKNETGVNYDLYVTGHSLGGALATFFAVKVAELELPFVKYPVTCVSFASPIVGDVTFQRNIRQLEADGLLRIVRVSNQNDLVPFMPSFLGYKHAGLHVKTFAEPLKPKAYFADETDCYGGTEPPKSWWRRVWNGELTPNLNYHHSLAGHRERLLPHENDQNLILQKPLNELYKKRIVAVNELLREQDQSEEQTWQ